MKERVEVEEFEAWVHAHVVGFEVNTDNMQGIHLQPGEEMTLNLSVIISGKYRPVR